MWLRVEKTLEDNPPTFFFKAEMTGKEPGDHPRLYISQARLDYLRKAVYEDLRWKTAMETLIALADAGVRRGPPDYAKRAERGGELDGKAHEQLWQRDVGNRIPHLALAYLLTGEKKYLDSAKAWFDFSPWIKDRRSPCIRSVEEKDGEVLIDCDVAPAYPLELGLTLFDRTISFTKNGNLSVNDTLATEAPAQYEWRFQVEGSLEKQGDSWLIRNGDVTAQIDLQASVPVTVDAAMLSSKSNLPYLRIRSLDKVKTAQLITKLITQNGI